MELDLQLKNQELQVLIVPLWNWNDAADYIVYSPDGSNRTFMELK